MALPPLNPWSGELTAGAQTVSALPSVQTSPFRPCAGPGSGYSYGYSDQDWPGGQSEARNALPFRPGHEQHSPSALDRLGFSKLLSGSEKKTRDGQAPKRRGPKPDSKPALTRRQELNRHAQRTHRERKELYIKALETEVLRLKEIYTDTSRERDRERDGLLAEIQRLKNLLSAHGIASGSPGFHQNYTSTRSQSASDRSSASHPTSSYNPGTSSTGYTSPHHAVVRPLTSPPTLPPPIDQERLDQIGIDFVLALEKPCMEHAQFLMVNASNDPDVFSGHVLNASCPPASYVAAHPDVPYGHKMPNIGMPDLVKLLDLSKCLPLEGEITPIMAWAGIFSHPRRGELAAKDFEVLKLNLAPKVRCYGFGAVLEEFEVRDALMTVLAPTPDANVASSLSQQQGRRHDHVDFGMNLYSFGKENKASSPGVLHPAHGGPQRSGMEWTG